MWRNLHNPLALFTFLAVLPSAQARDDLSGTWHEEWSETIYAVDQWGPHCGQAPKSVGRKKTKNIYNVQDRGVDLLFQGKRGREFSSTACQTKNPKVKAKERTIKDSLFLISCSSPENSDLYENGLYSFRVKSADRIEYRETTRFSRNVSGSMCVHTRRIRRLYLKQPDNLPPPLSAEPTNDPPVVGTKLGAHDPCEDPGRPVSLKIRPTSASLHRSENLCLKAQAKDANGCKTKSSLTWVSRAPAGVRLQPNGCIQIHPKARAGKHRLRLKSGKAQAQFTLRVVAKAARKQVAKAQPTAVAPAEVEPAARPPEEPPPVQEPTKPKVEPQPAAEPAVKPPAEPPAADPGPPAWLWILGIAGIILAGFGLFTLMRRDRSTSAHSLEHGATDPGPAPIQGKRVFCIQCGQSMPDGADFCVHCGYNVSTPPTSPPLAAEPQPVAKPQPVKEPQPVEIPQAVQVPRTLDEPLEEEVTQPEAESDVVAESFFTQAPAPVPTAVPEPKKEPQQRACPNCSKPIPSAAKFCPYCRTDLRQ